MLGLLGLFGLLFAGYIAEGMVADNAEAHDANADGGDDDEPLRDNGAATGRSVLEWAHDGPPADLFASLVPDNLMGGASDQEIGAKVGPDPSPGTAMEMSETNDSPAKESFPSESGGDESAIFSERNAGLIGGAGDDTLIGGKGDDQIHGDLGDDLMLGGAGNDTLHGEDGNDMMFGGEGGDFLAGHEGNDILHGGAGNDTLFGGGGDDTLVAGAGDDWLAGGQGDDFLVAGAGNDTLDGGTGDDTLIGGVLSGHPPSINYLNGGTGDDLIALGPHDIATGDAGADTFVLGLAGLPVDWASEPETPGVARIMDFDPAEDTLVVIYDAASHPEPHLTLRDGTAEGEVDILLDGHVLAQVKAAGGLVASQIRLVAR